MVTGRLAKPMPLPAQTDPPRSPRETLPTMYDLPSEDPEEPGLPDEFHDYQPQLLRETFQPHRYVPDHFFVASDLNLYYTLHQPTWYKRPDWFAVLGVSRLYDRRELRLSYVIWQEGVTPYIVVELLSPSTEREDLGHTERQPDQPPSKWMVYEQILRIPYYIVFSRATDEVRYFELTGGLYREVQPPGQRLWLPEADVGLGLWFGTYQGDWSGSGCVSMMRRAHGFQPPRNAGNSALSKNTNVLSKNASAPSKNTNVPSKNTSAPTA